jgi:hypothetical protein
MIYALIMKEKKGKYGRTDYTRAGETILRFEMKN